MIIRNVHDRILNLINQ